MFLLKSSIKSEAKKTTIVLSTFIFTKTFLTTPFLSGIICLFFLFLPNQSWAKNVPNSSLEPSELISQTYIDDDRFNQDDLLVLQVNVGNFLILENTIMGYKLKDKVFLSLRDFIDVVEFPIEFKNNLFATGWFIKKEQNFELDLNKAFCDVNHKKTNISPENLVVFDGEIFVEIKTLQQWFGLELSFSVINQEIVINSGGILPIESRFERQKEWKKLEESKEVEKNSANEKDDSQILNNDYKLASIPFGDLAYSQNYSKSENGDTNSTSQLSALFAGDFLYLNNQLFTTIQDSKITNVRLTSGRKDPDGNLLGVLGATEFSLGDVFAPELPLVSRSGSGKGAYVSNYPLEYVNEFNKTVVRGVAQANWEVEIYRNNSLLDFQKVGNDGIYEFTGVPLSQGLNLVKLVFYGPFGQKYEEVRKFMIGTDLLKQGKFYYRFSASKNNQDLIEIAPETATTPDKSDGKNRLFGELGYGITKSTSIVTNLTQVPVAFSDQTENFAGLSLRSSFFGVSARLDNVRNLDTGFNAQELFLQTTFLSDFNLTAELERYDRDFTSETHVASADPLINKFSTRIDGPIKIPFVDFTSRFSLKSSRENYESKKSRDELESDVFFGITRKLGLTQNFKYIGDERINTDQSQTIVSRTLMSYVISQNLSLRGTLFYDIKPQSELSGIDATTSYNFGDRFNFNFSANHQFSKDKQPGATNYSASISKSFDKFLLSFGTTYGSLGAYGASLNISTSFGYDARNNVGIMSSIPLATTGAVSAKVFMDENNNGKFDKGEESLRDVEVSALGAKRVKTNKDGVALITNIRPNGATKIMINLDSLPDPYLLVRKKSVKLVAHSGTINAVDFPISRVGEISGYAVIDRGSDKLNPASNLDLELIDQNSGEIAFKSTSGYDGFFLFDMVPFGKYRLQVSQEQSRRLHFVASKPYDLALNIKNEIIDDNNFIINFQSKFVKFDAADFNKKQAPKSSKFNIGGVEKFISTPEPEYVIYKFGGKEKYPKSKDEKIAEKQTLSSESQNENIQNDEDDAVLDLKNVTDEKLVEELEILDKEAPEILAPTKPIKFKIDNIKSLQSEPEPEIRIYKIDNIRKSSDLQIGKGDLGEIDNLPALEKAPLQEDLPQEERVVKTGFFGKIFNKKEIEETQIKEGFEKSVDAKSDDEGDFDEEYFEKDLADNDLDGEFFEEGFENEDLAEFAQEIKTSQVIEEKEVLAKIGFFERMLGKKETKESKEENLQNKDSAEDLKNDFEVKIPEEKPQESKAKIYKIGGISKGLIVKKEDDLGKEDAKTVESKASKKIKYRFKFQ